MQSCEERMCIFTVILYQFWLFSDKLYNTVDYEVSKKQERHNSEMKIYFAPLEGITGYIYRNAFHEFFGQGIDKYFTPFLAAAHGGDMKNRSLRDVLPENNQGLPIVPQILTNHAEDFTALRKQLNALGYREVNLNLGCPYRTVVAKGKGAGFLAKKEELEAFLDQIFRDCNQGEEISIKTRLGMESPEEFGELLAIYNQFPVKELTIHPRVQKEFYDGNPDRGIFTQALSDSVNPVCYNGDLFTKEDYLQLKTEYPKLKSVMLGRGFLVNPGLLQEIFCDKKLTKNDFTAFHHRLYHDYRQLMGEDKNTLFKMKELWNYWQYLFEVREEAGIEKHLKKIRKARNGGEYKAAVNALLGESEIAKFPCFGG